MARTDFRTPRLYVFRDLVTDAEVKLDPQQTNYLVNAVGLRRRPVLLFMVVTASSPPASGRAHLRPLRSLSVRGRAHRSRRRTSIICSLR